MYVQLSARNILALCAMAALLLSSGCASYQQSRALLQYTPADLPSTALIEDAPFVAQDDYYCGPSALSMMLQAQGIAPSLQTLTDMVYVPARQGSFQIELKAAARRFDLLPYQLAPNIEDVFREVASGNPVLVLQNLALQSSPTWHYAVVVGYDLDQKEVILHSGLEPFSRIAIGTFERTWLNGIDWALVILPPDTLPNTATPLAFQKVIEELVYLGQPSVALDAYHSALSQWPNNDQLLFGTANLLYQLNEFEEASERFLQAIKQAPTKAPYWNNLAYALAQLACNSAITAARCAQTLDANHAAFTSTAVDVENILKQTHTRVQIPQCPQLPTCE